MSKYADATLLLGGPSFTTALLKLNTCSDWLFFLSTPIYIQVERTSKDKDRPLLKKGDPTKILTKLHKEREGLYQSVSDYVVDTENKSSQEVASEIVNLVKA